MDQWITCFTDSGDDPVCPGDRADAKRNAKTVDKAREKKPESVRDNEGEEVPLENKREALSY